MNQKRIGQIIFSLALFCVVSATAQDFSSLATSMPQMKAVFAKILAGTPEFSASAMVEAYNTNGTVHMKMPMNFALTPDRMRQEIDVLGMPFPLESRTVMQKAHLDKIVVITQTDTKKAYLLFPGLQAYVEYPLSETLLDEINLRARQMGIQRTEFAQEMVGTHLCQQVRLIVTETNHPPEIALLRCATDLNQFPIRMDLLTPTDTTKFSFEDVQLKRPDAMLFEVPTNYVAFRDSAAISRYAMGKLKGNEPN